jgi:hypothetical protein
MQHDAARGTRLLPGLGGRNTTSGSDRGARVLEQVFVRELQRSFRFLVERYHSDASRSSLSLFLPLFFSLLISTLIIVD